MTNKSNLENGEKITHIFVHIPKTGGITFCNLIDRVYDPSKVFSIDGNNVSQSRDFMESLPVEQRAQFDWVKGHVAFGWDEYLPGTSRYFTILREPVSRIISEYYYILRTPSHPYHKQLAEENISLEDYGTGSLIWTCENAQVRSLSHYYNTGRKCQQSHLDTAVENLKNKFLFAGLQERFDETLLVLQRKLNWETPPYYICSNVAKIKPRKKEIGQKTIDAIKKHNALDVRFYDLVCNGFSKILEEEDLTESDLELFRIQNREFQANYAERMGYADLVAQ